MRWSVGAMFALLTVGGGCARAPVSPPLPTPSEWTAARAWLTDLRASEPRSPYGAIVQVALREPYTGRAFSARGAVAVDPHRALRLILVGPAGATALDVWATPTAWRFEVPAAHLLRRGGAEDDPSLPIGFFRWWFLAPLEGRLLTSVASGAAERFILRDRDATVDLTDVRGASHAITASRRWHGALDTIGFHGALAPAAGDRAVYDQERSGVHVEVVVEAPSDAPDALAFMDPDGPGGLKEDAP